MTTTQLTRQQEAELIARHTPVLVLYPEVPPGSVRQLNPNYPDEAPLLYDYHPRDVRMVLEYSDVLRWSRFWPSKKETGSWEAILNKLELFKWAKDLDVLPGVDQKDRGAFWSAYAAIPKDTPEYGRRCYARVVQGKGINSDRILVQYWYAYFYNDFWNIHEMDWEVVMVVLKLMPDGRALPTVAAYSAHMGGHWLPWPRVEKADDSAQPDQAGTHPVVYVANGSHANYFYGPALFPTAPPSAALIAGQIKKNRPLVDYTASWTSGDVRMVEAAHMPASEEKRWADEWRWLNLLGRWGSPGRFLDLEFGDSGPLGPSQGGDRWDFPFRWIVTSCSRAPDQEDFVIPTRLEPVETLTPTP